MGGHALKRVKTRRYSAEEYHNLVPEVIEKLQALFPDKRIATVKAYREKPSFGDMDVLVEGPYPTDVDDLLQAAFSPGELVSNGPVKSFDYKELQIDLIVAPSEEFSFTENYLSFNDMGNLLGKIAHKFGVKWGHDGMFYIYRDGDFVVKSILLTRDLHKAYKFLGLNADRAIEGFDKLEEMFTFVASSPFFNVKYYLLSHEEKSGVDRVRTAKRKTYQQFLSWLEAYTSPHTPYVPLRDKSLYLPRIEEHFPGFLAELEAAKVERAVKVAEDAKLHEKFNVDLVQEWLGCDRSQMNKLMTLFSQHFSSKEERRAWLLKTPAEEVKQLVIKLGKDL